MLRIQILDNVVLSLRTDDGNTAAPLEVEGNPGLGFFDWLEQQFNPFGHRVLASAMAPIDLHYVLFVRGADLWEPKVLEGAELVESYDPNIPEGAVT